MTDSTPPPPLNPNAEATVDSEATVSQFQPKPAAPPVVIQIEGYRLLDEISRGGQAIVYAATFLRTGRKVAVKVMREGPLATEAGRARFTREAQIIASLNHPNIVTILDRGRTADGSEYFAMDFIDGQALDQGTWKSPEYLASSQENPAEPLQLFLKICDAVNAAHLRGIVHRDLKPSNIRLDERGEPHVLDFGLARGSLSDSQAGTAEPITITGQFLGSIPWASPEQAEGIGQKIDMRSDVYSLGVILYQLVTGGHFPYQVVGSMRDILNNIMTAEPPAPSSILADREARDLKRRARRASAPAKLLNPVLDAIVLRALAKRRDDRYQSAGELARDIENSLAGRPTVAGSSAPRRVSTNRQPLMIAATAILVIGIGALIAFLMKGGGANPPNTGGTTMADAVNLPKRIASSSTGIAATSATQKMAQLPELAAKSPLLSDYIELMGVLGRGQPIINFFQDHGKERIDAWRAAAAAGDPVGQMLLARCYQHGTGVPTDPQQANSYLRMAADEGLPMAMELMGMRYRQMAPPNQDFALAMTWYRRAADTGDGRAMVDIGMMYLQGLGVPVDNAEALRWFKQGADLDVPSASWHLGDMYMNGSGVEQNYVQAVKYYRQAVDNGMPSAMFSLGVAYMLGRGVAPDYAEAMKWYKTADSAGAISGAMGIGDLYANGRGVTQDYAQAANYYQKSANAGVIGAMRKLAALYDQGKGALRNDKLARDWYTKAADAGDAESKQWLANNTTQP